MQYIWSLFLSFVSINVSKKCNIICPIFFFSCDIPHQSHFTNRRYTAKYVIYMNKERSYPLYIDIYKNLIKYIMRVLYYFLFYVFMFNCWFLLLVYLLKWQYIFSIFSTFNCCYSFIHSMNNEWMQSGVHSPKQQHQEVKIYHIREVALNPFPLATPS